MVPNSKEILNGRLENKVAIVTGSSRGIGRAIAEAFSREGAKVVINYNRSKSDAMELFEKLKQHGALLIKADVSKSKEVNELVRQTISKFGRIDILVNNAGILNQTPFLESTEEEWDEVLDTNLKSTYLCSRIVAPIMLKQETGGKIINISSVSGLTGQYSALGFPSYVASKAGVLGLTRSLAVNLGPKVNVNAICPGVVKTDMSGEITSARRRKLYAETPLRSTGLPEMVADAAVFFASKESDWITGEFLAVAGGRGMR